MKKKIGILTITDNCNLGNRLQNYASQEILKEYGDVESIVRYYGYENTPRLKFLLRNIKTNIFFILKRFFKSKRIGNMRNINFKKFNKYIKFGSVLHKSTDFSKLDSKYDIFAVGSDQIWNPNFFNDNMYVNMLGFTANEKKLAIAPSIAVEELTKVQETEFKKWLKDFDCLSCREEQGANLVKKLTSKECISLIDPTLMLSQEDWNKVSKKPKFHDESKKYLLLYFLGNMTEGYKKQIDLISKTFNLDIINVADKNSIYYSCGPSEFIYLIKNCEIMLTDSFHGSVFSYIYDRPLRIFKREDKIASMNSRLTNLMNKFNLNNDIYFNCNLDLGRLFDVNYDKSYLIKEQEKFRSFLDYYFNK